MALPATFDFKDAGSVRFRTAEDLKNFLLNERNVWQWAMVLRNLQSPGDVLSGLRSLWDTHWQNINSAINALDSGNADQAENWILSHFVNGSPLPISGSPKWALIENVRTNIGERAAIGALAGLTDRRFDGQDPEQVRGLFAAHEFLSGTGKAARQSVQDGLSTLLKQLGGQQRRAEEKADDLDRRIERTEHRRARNFKKLLDTIRRSRREFGQRTFDDIAAFKAQINEQLASFVREKDDSIASIQNTEKTYSEHMELQAPVTYWTGKAAEHKEHEKTLKKWVIGYFAATIPAIVLAFGLTGGWLIGISAGGGKVDSPLYIVAGAGLAAVTSMVLWAGRLLTRFYLSQNHLHHDANDRAVMTKTYLALSSVRQAEEKDRAIILAALFRPTSDGIVKDDAGPDLGVAGVASKILAGGRPQ